jgi:iron-sulfur cluster repair protein YtfE (RIC family)
MPPTESTLDPEAVTVHEAMQRIAGADEVFSRFGVDTCCGGELPLAVAAEHHDVDLELLLDALEIARDDG